MQHYFNRLQDAITLNWSHDALCDYGGASYTFGDVAVYIEKLHIFFQSLGVRKGDKIALCGKNQARWGVSFLSINTYEAVAVPILADFTPESIASIVDHSGSVILFTDQEIFSRLDISRIPSLKTVINIGDFSILYGSDRGDAINDYVEAQFAKQFPDGFSPCDINYPTDNDKDLAVINYTSGSTGDPKGVMLRYECFSANIEYGQDNVPSNPGDHILSILPMAHMFGFMFEMVYPLCGGATIYFLGRTPAPSVLMKAMRGVRPYLVIAVPMVFEKIYRSKMKPAFDKPLVKVLTHIPGIRGIVFSKFRRSVDEAFGGNVREYIMGGAAVNPEVEEFFKRIGFHYTVGYGMTEAAPLMAYSDWSTFKVHSCGRAMSFVQLRINSSDPEHIVGEIQAKGVNLFSGYFKNESATRAAFTDDGWFNTGDLGLIDREGNVYIKGRCKTMLLSSNGQNIYPEEVESVINSQPYVQESLLVSREGKLVGLVCLDDKAVQCDAKDPETLRMEIQTSVNSKLPKYSQIHNIEIRQEPFQKTPKQSIKRFLYS